LSSEGKTMIAAGAQAPDFELPDQDGKTVKLSALRGQTIVLYFYPRADTPGCTTQACGIRDHAEDYASRDAVVLGVSPDPVEKVKAFHDKFAMNFTLLADPDHAVCDAYGTWVEKTNYGKTYMGVQRATFIIAADGTIAQAFPKVSPQTHDTKVLEALDDLAGAAA